MPRNQRGHHHIEFTSDVFDCVLELPFKFTYGGLLVSLGFFYFGDASFPFNGLLVLCSCHAMVKGNVSAPP